MPGYIARAKGRRGRGRPRRKGRFVRRVKAIARAVVERESELKLYVSNPGEPIGVSTDGWFINLFDGIPVGTDSGSRIGRQIRAYKTYINVVWTPETNASNVSGGNVARFMLLVPREGNNMDPTTPPDASNIFPSNGLISPVGALVDTRNWIILFDKTQVFQTTEAQASQPNQVFKIQHDFKGRKFLWTNDDPDPNSPTLPVWFVVFSDSGNTPNPTFDYDCHIRFTDT